MHREVTAGIVEQLRKGVRPWTASGARGRAWERCGEEDRRWFLERIRKQTR